MIIIMIHSLLHGMIDYYYYMSILGKFIGPNTMEVIDSKGKASTITAARFVIATGGRPTQLDIPGQLYLDGRL